MLLNYFSTLKLIWDLWYDCRFIVMVLCPSDISIWVNTGHRTTQHLSNFHPCPALLQPGDTLSRLICLSATEIVVDIRDLLVTVTWVWPVSVCNVEHVTVVTRHITPGPGHGGHCPGHTMVAHLYPLFTCAML